MVDRPTRDVALRALERFLRCETDSDKYESEYPLPELFGRKESKDMAIRAIHGMSWNWFDDFHPHKLEGKHALDGDILGIAEKCVAFLKSDCEYEWRESNFMSTGWTRSVLTTLHLVRAFPTVQESLAHHLDQPEGDAAVWPFFRSGDCG